MLVEGAVTDGARKRLAGAGLPLSIGAQRDDRAGHAQIVRKAPTGDWESATDPRGDGNGPG